MNGIHGIGNPIAVETQDDIVILHGPQSIVIVAPTVALNDNHVVRVHRSDRGNGLVVKVSQWSILHVTAAIRMSTGFKTPIGLIDQVVPSNPGFVSIALGKLDPKCDRFADVF